MPALTIRFRFSSKNDGSICKSNPSQTRSVKSRIFHQIPHFSGEFCRAVQTLATRDIMPISSRGRAIIPRMPTDNASAESFHGSMRDGCMNTNWFLSLEDVQRKIAALQRHYNESRAHAALGDVPASEFAGKPGQFSPNASSRVTPSEGRQLCRLPSRVRPPEHIPRWCEPM
jgi:hypothetical protein